MPTFHSGKVGRLTRITSCGHESDDVVVDGMADSVPDDRAKGPSLEKPPLPHTAAAVLAAEAAAEAAARGSRKSSAAGMAATSAAGAGARPGGVSFAQKAWRWLGTP